MSPLLTDADVIAASRADPPRFELIFERHFDPIHAYLQRRVGPQSADDLAAETFVEAFSTRARYDASRPDARPWLFGIATNLVRHQRRRERRQLRAYARSPYPVAEAGYDAAEDRADAAAARPNLVRALASLPVRDREILLLYAWADLTYAEIAEALDVPIGTVRSGLSRARERMRELIPPERASKG